MDRGGEQRFERSHLSYQGQKFTTLTAFGRRRKKASAEVTGSRLIRETGPPCRGTDQRSTDGGRRPTGGDSAADLAGKEAKVIIIPGGGSRCARPRCGIWSSAIAIRGVCGPSGEEEGHQVRGNGATAVAHLFPASCFG